MTPSKIVEAHRAVLELSRIVLPYPAARKLARLQSRLASEVDTIHNMEVAMAEEHGGTMRRNGACDFPSAEDREAFEDAREDYLAQEDNSIHLPKVDLSMYTAMIRVSASALTALEGIVDFGGDKDG